MMNLSKRVLSILLELSLPHWNHSEQGSMTRLLEQYLGMEVFQILEDLSIHKEESRKWDPKSKHEINWCFSAYVHSPAVILCNNLNTFVREFKFHSVGFFPHVVHTSWGVREIKVLEFCALFHLLHSFLNVTFSLVNRSAKGCCKQLCLSF